MSNEAKKEHIMKTILPAIFLILSACVSNESTLVNHLEAEADFHNHQLYLESVYDQEYIDDCFHYDELICEFE
jgi:starvation-inducible outer membrane lipoprotein